MAEYPISDQLITESERKARVAITLACEALLAAILRDHAPIVQRLTAKQTNRSN